METRQLGNSDLKITTLGIGAWAIGGSGWLGSMGPQDENDSIPAIHAALDRGLNWIDTAALYGLGHSEEVVARALKAVSYTHLTLPTACAACKPVSLTSTKFTGRNRTRILKKVGANWPDLKKKAKCATSEFQTLASRK